MARDTFFAVAPFGLETFLEEEIKAAGGTPIETSKGGVKFTGDKAAAMRLSLNSRFASRILMEVTHKKYWDSHDLYDIAKKTPWETFFSPDQTIKLSATSVRCPLESIDFAMLRVKDAICDRFVDMMGRRPSVDRQRPDVRIAVFLTYDTVTLYLDLSGESLFKRGWRLSHGEAPLKENLAAGLLALAQWDPSKPLVDPFCGSGTIVIEAAHMAMNRAPGLERTFAFESLMGFDLDLWKDMREDALANVNRYASVQLFASDISSLVVEKAEDNARRAGLEPLMKDGRLVFKAQDAREITPPTETPGIVIANPPYGEQSNPKSASIQAMMKNFGDQLKANFAGWTAWLLTSDRLLPRQMRLQESRKTVLFNGPLECRFFRFEMVAGSHRKPKADAPEA